MWRSSAECSAHDEVCDPCLLRPLTNLTIGLETAAALTVVRTMTEARVWSNRDVLDGFFDGDPSDDWDNTYFPHPQSLRVS
jgi:hypothetical protein